MVSCNYRLQFILEKLVAVKEPYSDSVVSHSFQGFDINGCPRWVITRHVNLLSSSQLCLTTSTRTSAFDFNHLNNILVSRDYQSVRLIDIDGNAQGSINYPSISQTAHHSTSNCPPQKPSLNVDLNILLPSVVEQLILGKGRGRSFVSNTRSEIWRAKEEEGKAIIRRILMENFYPGVENQEEGELNSKLRIHAAKVAEWFYALLKKKSPWTFWTRDIYDAMRCIDHLPIS